MKPPILVLFMTNMILNLQLQLDTMYSRVRVKEGELAQQSKNPLYISKV